MQNKIDFDPKGNYYGFEMESDELTKIGPIFTKNYYRSKNVNNKSFSPYPIFFK